MHARDNITEEIKEAARRSEQMPFRALDKVWDRIEEKLDEEERIIEEKHNEEIKKERRVITFRTASIAAAVSILISLGTTYFLHKNYADKEAPSLTRQTSSTENKPVTDNAQNIVASNNEAPVATIQKIVENKPVTTSKPGLKLVVKHVVPDPVEVQIMPPQKEYFVARKTIKGKVTDESGDPVAGAIILARGEKESTITDLDGNYEIAVSEKEKELVIKRLGMLSKTIEIGEQGLMATMLESDNTDVTNSHSDASGSLNNNIASNTAGTVSDLEKAIEGKLPGVKIVRHGGRSPFSADLYVGNAGSPSTTSESSPLVVIDGMFYSGTSVSLKPDEVVSLTVLKDKKAISAYGSKGTNGVIVITTKSGKGFSEPRQNLLQKVKKIFDRKDKDEE
jgi:TonB-dependent SusC/RagA subfamily outer membrane receptor